MKKNKIRKIILSLFMIIAIVLNTGSVDAATAPATLKMGYTTYKPPISFPQAFHVKKTTDGKYVYCATYAKNMPVTSIKYTKSSEYTDAGINYILEQGYKAKNDKEYFVAQTAYWIYLMDTGKMTSSNSVKTFKNNISKSSNTYAKQIKNMVSKAKSLKSYDKSSPTIKLSSGTVKFALSDDGKYYVSDKITVTSSEANYKVELVGAPSGTTYSNDKGVIYVKVPVSSVTNTTKSFSIKVSNSKTIYRSYKYTPSNSKYQTMSATYPSTKNATASKNMSLKVDKVVISKQDVTTKQELPGATLVLKDANGTKKDEWVSGNTPHEISLAPGKYTLTETIAPEGYDLSTESIEFEVTNNGVDKNVVMYNTPSKTEVKEVQISKQDATTKEELPGATLVLKDENGTKKDEWVSGATPHVVTDLKPGKYTLTETIAPEGYELSTESVEFTVDENGNADKVVMYNTPKKSVESQVSITKVDADSKDMVAGATLEVKDSNGNVVETFVSDTSAHIIKGLAAGTYTLTEKEAPEGYELATEPVQFTVVEGSEDVVSVTMYNKKAPTEQTPGEEVAVPATGKNKTAVSSVIGLIIISAGSVLVTKKVKKNEI